MDTVTIVANGVTLPSPSTFKVDYEDLHGDATGRNINTGKLMIQRVRANLTKGSMTWHAETPANAHILENALSSKVSFTATFYSPRHGARVTKTMYCSTFTNEWEITQSGTRFNITANMIEV